MRHKGVCVVYYRLQRHHPITSVEERASFVSAGASKDLASKDLVDRLVSAIVISIFRAGDEVFHPSLRRPIGSRQPVVTRLGATHITQPGIGQVR